MAKVKTAKTKVSVNDYINSLEDEKKREESRTLIQIMKEVTGEEPYMFGPSIIGFGNYHYKYPSGHEGDAPLAGFSPRKAAISLYLEKEFPGREEMLGKLGKCKAAVACVYIKKLDDVDLSVLKKMIKASLQQTLKLYPDKDC